MNEPKNSKKTTKQLQISPQDALFVNHISYLTQLSYLNLTQMKSEKLARSNQHTIRMLTNKKPIKLSSDLKYFYCKKCEIMLVPGETSRIRLKSKRSKHVTVTCLKCNSIKRYLNEKTSQSNEETNSNKNTST